MAKLRLSKDRVLQQGGINTPTHEKSNILSFPNYFKYGKVELGIHGPEEKNDKIYLSVYHYMQYNNDRYDPNEYDT